MKPLKLAIDIGHNCPPDSGAIGIKSEDKLNIEIGYKVINLLSKVEGITCINVTPKKATSVVNSLFHRTDTANLSGCKYYLSIHHNKGGGHGTEIFAMTSLGRAIASPILKEICHLGFKNRGIKDGSGYFVLRNSTMPAIIIEVCFVDSQEDINLWDADKIADAIVKGFLSFVKNQA
jgi:N-acetylmuramoyl-L-alanine amidase